MLRPDAVEAPRRTRSFGSAPAFRLCCGLLSCSLLLTCGKKGNPYPPIKPIPGATTDLSLHQKGNELLLTMSYPRTTASGHPLPSIQAVELWQMVVPAPSSPELPKPDLRAFAAGAELKLTLRGAELQSVTQGDRIVTRLPLPREETGSQVHILGVRTLSPDGDASAFSNLVQLVLRPSPPPPEDLRVVPNARGIELRWQRVEAEVEGFHVYRRLAVSRAYSEPLARLSATRTSFLDETAVFGERYIYTVSSVASRRPLVESALAAEREVDYQDRFPPAPPADLLVLAERGRIRLVWQPSPDSDVAGYRIERQDPRAEFRTITEPPVADLEFLDGGLVAGLTYRYRVRAVDVRGNEGEAGEEVEAIAQ